jgi:hypothetical protein
MTLLVMTFSMTILSIATICETGHDTLGIEFG